MKRIFNLQDYGGGHEQLEGGEAGVKKSIRSCRLLEELLDGHVLLGVLLHDLGHGHLKVLLGHVHPSLAQSVHAWSVLTIKYEKCVIVILFNAGATLSTVEHNCLTRNQIVRNPPPKKKKFDKM